ncbi:hypothetical protein K9M16_00085 [Candidatus Babeliales bacterium]|nr:hypothetical protein [Candidatus Babeliales bacterium]
MNKKKFLIIIILLITLISIPLLTVFRNSFINFYNRFFLKEKPQVCLNIFVHGTFNCVLGFFDTYKVIKDEISGTQYKKMLAKLRKNPFFYKNQPILQKGLIKIKPTFDLMKTNNKIYGIYPISKAYLSLMQEINPTEKNLFYTLGWSGLISQSRRRFEAIRFYNILSQEIEKYKKRGLNPKIRILAHSHGGNLILNFAAIKNLIQDVNNNPKDISEKLKKDIKNSEEKESLVKMLDILQKFPIQKNAEIQKGFKKYDYMPINKDLLIDELILFGTPIQPETENFVYSDIFKKVYNFYSDEDYVQSSDWVSTKNLYSKQRIENIQKNSNLIQAKIMIERPIKKEIINEKNKIKSYLIEQESKKQDKPGYLKNFLNKITHLKDLFFKKHPDPTHRELWFTTWNQDTIIAPLPIVVFTPILLKLINDITDKNQIKDFDINLKYTKKNLKFYISKHDDSKVLNKKDIPKHVIEKLKANVEKWRPKENFLLKEFEITNKCIQSVKNS